MGPDLDSNRWQPTHHGLGIKPIEEAVINIFRRIDPSAFRTWEGVGTVCAFPTTLSFEGKEIPLDQFQDFGGRDLKALKFLLQLGDLDVPEVRLAGNQEQNLIRMLCAGTIERDFNCISFVSHLLGVGQTTFKNLSPSDWNFRMVPPGAALEDGEAFLIGYCVNPQQLVPTLSDLDRAHAGFNIGMGLTMSCYGNVRGAPISHRLIFASIEELMQGYHSNVVWSMHPKR